MELDLNKLSFQELKAMAKEKGISLDKTDNKVIIAEKLKNATTTNKGRVSNLTNVRNQMKETKKVIVTKLNPDDTIRNEVLITIMNATGSYEHPVMFGKEIVLPVPIIRNLEGLEYQAWRKVSTEKLGMQDVPYMTKAYSIQTIIE